MSSTAGEIGSTLTGGIQDIAGILPLLGTEQCLDQVSSALSRGYLYAASTPMSIFGSLGVVSAGVKTLVACFSFRGIEGAKILANMGFEPQGENLSLIMVEAAGKGKGSGRYIIETRIEELIEDLNIDQNRITGVSHKSTAWNVKMMATTALLCAFSITPYIYLNQGANNLTTSTRWVFPVLRATGGFITTTLIQLLIQRRITTLSDQYLVKRNQQRDTDLEAGDTKKCQMIVWRIAPTWLLLFLLFNGLVASIVGYVGCFSVVQNSISSIGPLSWLCLETVLSVMRLAIWAWNPMGDDAPPLEIILELDKYEHDPLPTCNKDNAEILQNKVLPLTRAQDFLKIITSFAGLIEPFINPDLSLYYTLTRRRPFKDSVFAEEYKLGERVLYITVFDHKERTTRVYTRDTTQVDTQDDEGDIFYSTTSDAPHFDVGHFLLEVEIDAKIDPKGDPVSREINNRVSLRNHHRTILEHIHYRLGAGDAVTRAYAIENTWTMKLENTISAFQRLRKEKGDDWKAVVEKGMEKERNEGSLPICGYFTHASIERERRLLDEKRTKWIARRSEMMTQEWMGRFAFENVEYRVNNQAVEKMPAPHSEEEIRENEMQQREERWLMEMMLICEVKEWELLFWNKLKEFLDQIGNDRVEEKERLTREWRADSWKRLNSQMLKRLTDYRDKLNLESLGKQWTSSISQFFEGVEKPYSISLSKLKRQIILRNEADNPRIKVSDEILLVRFENEIEDIEFRLKRGSDLGRFDQFWDDESVFDCWYSRSKWLYIWQDSTIPLEIYSRALKGNKNITHITFGSSDNDSDVNRFQVVICDLPWVTSLSWDSDTPPAIHRDLLFIKSTENDLITFAKENRLKLDPSSTYIFIDADGFDMASGRPEGDARILISFVAPFWKSLILRLKHFGSEDAPLEVKLGPTIIQLNSPSDTGLKIDDITLHPIQDPSTSESDHTGLSFEPGVRNDIIINFRRTVAAPEGSHGHSLSDIKLLDESGLEYSRNRNINVD